jgi:hypothetical protein
MVDTVPIIGKKISSGMRSDCGRQCCDTVSSLKKACRNWVSLSGAT